MNWTEPQPPTEGVNNYDHITCETPLGTMVIEWKSWKESPCYTVELNGDVWIGSDNTIEGAKILAKEYLSSKSKALVAFLNSETVA